MISLLYVDDEPVLLELCRNFLEQEGDISVTTVSSVQEALRLLISGRFDAIISDYQMPDIDGLQFLQRVRQQYPDIPFILFTGRGREEVVIKAINSGVDSYVQKGGDPKAQFKELTHLIRQVVRRRKAENELRLMKFSVDHASEGILWMRTDGTITYYNDALCLMLGYTPQEFSLLSLKDIRPGFSPNSPGGIFDNPEGHLSAAREVILRKKDGSLIPVELMLNSSVQGKESQVFAFVRDISERRRAETDLEQAVRQLMTREDELRRQFEDLKKSDCAIREIRERYRMLLDETEDWIWESDGAGHITRSSFQVQDLLGYGPWEITGKTVGDLLMPEERPRVTPVLEGYFARNEAFRAISLKMMHRDGAARELELSGTPMFSPEGGFLGFHGIARPCLAGTRPADHPDRIPGYRALLEHVGDAIIVTDAETGMIVDANQKALALVKRSQSEISGLHESVLHPPVNSVDGSACHADIPDAEVSEEVLVDREGTRIPVIASTKCICVGSRGLRIGIYHDISDLLAIQEALKEKSGELDRFFTTGPDLFCILDAEGRILRLNPAGGSLLGSPVNEPEMRSLFDAIDQEDREATRTVIHNLVRSGRAVTFVNRVRHTDGSCIWLEWPAFMPGRKRIYAVARDMTEQRRVETALAEATRKLHLLSDLTCHDIKNKLTVLTGYLDLFRKCPGEPYFSMYADKIGETVAAIAAQIEFTRVYKTLGNAAPGWYSVSRLSVDACSHTSIPPDSVRSEAGSWDIFADPLIERVFSVLIDNVVKHAATFTEIRCTARESLQGLLIVFEDNGVGIPQDSKERIFERGMGQSGSFAYNLYLAREILSITGITIRETGHAGKGARFEMLVPKGMYRRSLPDTADDYDSVVRAPHFITSTHHTRSI